VKIHDDFMQGSEDWFLTRCGKATASEFSSILAKGQGKMRASYLKKVVAERLTKKPGDTYRNVHMDRGAEQEPLARMAYELKTGNIVQQVGFVEHDSLMAGCSPDGLIDQDGGAEIKCVIPTVQLETILAGGYPNEHKAQVQGNLWLTGRQWWDFCSYSPDMPGNLRTYILRVLPEADYIASLEAEVRKFLDEVDAIVEKLQRRAA